MKRTCEISGVQFDVDESDTAFYSDNKLPIPSLSPLERQRRRTSFRNFSSLYNSRCQKTGADIITMYPPDSPFPVYSNEAWWSDDWSAKDISLEYTSEKSFFSQYRALANAVPKQALQTFRCENSKYSNFAFDSKDCYLVFGCVRNESCLYGHIVWESENCLDNLYIYRCQWCSNSIDIVECYNVHYSQESENCADSFFLYDCKNCTDCFGCVGLRKKRYCWFNKQLSKEDYNKRLAEFVPLSSETVEKCSKKIGQFVREHWFKPESYSKNCEGVSGNHIYFSKDALHCFDVKNNEATKYCYTNFDTSFSYDVSFGSGTFCYEAMALVDSERCFFADALGACSDVFYSEYCFSSKDLFGCNGLRNATFCILNKQYSQDEYRALKAKIIEDMRSRGEWGNYFPSGDSPFAYNESAAGEYLPLHEQDVKDRGLKWKNEESSIGSSAGKCTCCISGKGFNILKKEKELIRKMGVALPNTSPAIRHKKRMALRAPRALSSVSCTNCDAHISSAYTEKVLCQNCYLKKLY